MYCLMIYLILIAVIKISAKNKYNDEEDHPYEFGFTVDGQQHRHEMKDTNGIIQGEFGFITADGIYHTTVYATDENGDFKILSMRNVRVSPPLDQLEGKIQSFQQDQNPSSIPPPPPTARPQRDPYIQNSPIRAQPPPPAPLPMQYVSSTHAPFTTPSTIKPACAGCGYITRKPIPDEKVMLPLQTIVFQNPSNQITGAHKKEGNKAPPAGGTQYFNGVVGQQQEGLVPEVGVHDKSFNAGFSQVPPGSSPQIPISIFNEKPSPINDQKPPSSPVVGHFNTAISIPSIESKYPVSGNQASHPISGIPDKEQIPFGDPHGGIPQFNPSPAVSLVIAPARPINGDPQNHEAKVEVHDKSTNAGFSQVPPGSPPQIPISVFNEKPSPINDQKPLSSPVVGHFNTAISIPSIESKYPVSGNQASHPISGIPAKEQIPFGDPHGGIPQFNPNPAVGLIIPPAQPINRHPQIHEVIPRPIRDDITVTNGQINIPNHNPIKIQDKFPGMVDGLPPGVSEKDITDLLYRFNYTVGFHGHYEKGYKNGAKVGGYFVNGRDGVSRIVTYVADENGYRPKVKFLRLGLDSSDVPKVGSEKKFGLKSFEFVWHPIS